MQNFYCKNFVIMQTIANIFDKYYVNITKQLNIPKKLKNNAGSKKVIEVFEIHQRDRQIKEVTSDTKFPFWHLLSSEMCQIIMQPVYKYYD